MAVFTRKHGAVTLKDRTGSPIIATLGPGVGDFKVSGIEDGPTDGSSYTRPADAISVTNRGSHLEWVEGDEHPINGSITVLQDGSPTHATNKTPWDGVAKTGAFASGTTADPGAVVWTTDIVYTATRGALTITLTLKDCRCKLDYAEAAEGNTQSITFECRGGYNWA